MDRRVPHGGGCVIGLIAGALMWIGIAFLITAFTPRPLAESLPTIPRWDHGERLSPW